MRRIVIVTLSCVLAAIGAGSALAQEGGGTERGITSLANQSREYLDRIEQMKASAGEPETPAEVNNITTTFSGQFGYYRDDGEFVGARNLNLRVLQVIHTPVPVPGEPIEILNTQTDEDGFFFQYLNWDWFQVIGSYSELVVEFSTDGGPNGVSIKQPQDIQLYTWTTSFRPSSASEEWSLGQFMPNWEEDFAAVHLFSLVRYASKVLYQEWGGPMAEDSIYFPSDGNSHPYNWFVAFVSREEAWREDIVFRYFGHLIDNWVSGFEPSELCNGRCDTGPHGCLFCDWCPENVIAGWNEGFALFIASELTRRLSEERNSGNVETYDFESLQNCYNGLPGGAQITPGFTAALLNDLVDPVDPTDDHALFPGYADALDLSVPDILAVLEQSNPSTTMEFLAAFAAQYPNSRYELWETAINCGFDADLQNPWAVTDLASSSHPLGGSSTDQTLDITWTAAEDDMSGIEGYAIIITALNGMPYGEMAVGDVTSYTSEVLAPGTYFFNIRAKDYSGHWSTSYNYYGPFTVLDPLAIDLVHMVHPNWDDYSFPSQGNFNSYSSAHVNPILEGNVSGNHWNLGGRNTGSAATSVPTYGQAFIDGALQAQAFWSVINGGGQFYSADSGNYTVTGGRHSFHTKIDGTEVIGETDETNNIHGRQYVWSGLPLAADQVVTRNAPKRNVAGWDNVVGARYVNCDGLSFTSTGWWNVVAVRPQSDLANYSCQLHVGSTGSTNGFSISQATSYRPAGTLDAVLVNRNTMGAMAWDVGVVNPNDYSDAYQAELRMSTEMALGDSLTISMDSHQRIMLKEVNITAADLGNISINLQIPYGEDQITLSWFDRNFQTGTLLDHTASTQTDSEGRATLDLNVTEIGYYGLAIYRDAVMVQDPAFRPTLDITLEVQPTPADLAPLAASGWYSPLVPRPANDGTFNIVNLPTVLAGNASSTYLNFAFKNQGLLAATSPRIQINLDGEPLQTLALSYLAPGGEARVNYPSSYSVRGGRHTLSMNLDYQNLIEEMDEDNNTFGEQFVWSPLPVANETGVTRLNPPAPTGGWDEAAAHWYNCDGLRMEATSSSYWQAAAIMPTLAYGNPDVRLHIASEGATTGFQSSLAGSYWSAGSSDFVLANFNATWFQPFDIGVLAGAAGYQHGYRAQVTESVFLGISTPATYGPFTMGGDEIIDLYEWAFSPGTYQITLENVSGSVDWGLSLHSQDEPFQSKSTAIENCTVWLEGPGNSEVLNFEVLTTEYRCLAVWKVATADLPLSGQYRVTISSGVSGVDDLPVPTISRLIGARPNPFNPATTIDYELEMGARVDLVIYDVTGAKIRTLVSENMGAGSHEADWNGKDNSGQPVASGTYLARLVVDGKPLGMNKLVLIK